MKFTSFNPLIITSKGAETVKLFEDLGFEKRHTNENVDNKDITNITLKNPDGFQVDVANAPNTKQDITIIRMNVDNFDEAYEFLTAKGFINKSGNIVETASSKSCMMVSPSGFAFDLCHHKKS
ncbi:MAG: hypothetical protein IJ696_05610 [Ruminococcus sp.]|nr:hypothetical protein [Ruminococcus sp.]